jgi:hypothetical protein
MVTLVADNINWYCLILFRFAINLCWDDWKNIQKSLFCKIKKVESVYINGIKERDKGKGKSRKACKCNQHLG